MKVTTTLFMLSSLLVPLLAGCVDDPTADESVDDDQLGETTQDLGTALVGYTCSTTAPCNFNLGSMTNRACFLAGIRGAAAGSYVGINPYEGDYVLTIYAPANGVPVTATTTCVTPAANVKTALWSTNFGVPSVQIAGTNASSRCFLTKFASSGAGMKNYNDSIRTWRDSNGNWFLGGSSSGYVSGNAICFDASNAGEWAWGQTYGSNSGWLASNTSSGVACGLTELGGVFTAPNEGVHITYLSLYYAWKWYFVGAKHAYANCIQ